MAKFRKKPIEIEASQWFKHGDCESDNESTLIESFEVVEPAELCNKCSYALSDHGRIVTLEGSHIVCPGDWIITGIQNERYPCKPDIFEQTYDIVT